MRENRVKKSIWEKEIYIPIKLPKLNILKGIAFWLAFACILVCIVHPLPLTVFALQKKTIDYPYINYGRLVREWIYPFVRNVGGASLIFALVTHRRIAIKHWREHPVFGVFILLAGWMLVTTCINGWNFWAKWGTQTMGQSVWVEVAYFVLLFPLCALLIDGRWKIVLLRLHLFVTAFLSVAAFPLWVTQVKSMYIMAWNPVFSCIHINTNYYGYYLTVAVALSVAMVCAEEKPLWKGFAAFCLVVNTVALSYNNTMGAWVGSFFACLFLIVALRIRDGRFSFWGWVSFGIFLGVMLVTGAVNGFMSSNVGQMSNDVINLAADSGSEASMHAGSGRWILWVRCMSLIKAHPWFGLGFECVLDKDMTGFFFDMCRPHNEFMEYALFYGIPAAVLYILGCLGVYLRALRYKAQLDGYTLAALTAAFGYLVGSFFGLTVYNTAPYLFIMLGLGYVHTWKESEGKS